MRTSAAMRAFTLVEMLVTTGIIMVLSALLFTGYRWTTGAAMGAKNLANHRVITQGLLAYAQEHRGRLPWLVDYEPEFNAGASGSGYAKTLLVLGYVSDGRVFFSPRFWPRWSQTEGLMTVISNPQKFPSVIVPWAYTNYGVNRYGAMPNQTTDAKKPASILRVAGDGNLGKLMLTRDTYSADNDKAPAMLRGGGKDWFANASTIPNEEDTYGGIVHAGFADGHVEGIPRQKMVDMMSSGTAAPLFNNVYTVY